MLALQIKVFRQSDCKYFTVYRCCGFTFPECEKRFADYVEYLFRYGSVVGTVFVLIPIHKFIINVRVLCLIMLLVFGVSINTQVLTMCIIALFASFWEFVNLFEFLAASGDIGWDGNPQPSDIKLKYFGIDL